MQTYFLSSLDSARFATTRECVFQKRLRFNTGKESALVKLNPPVVGQDFGLGTDIELFVLANRYKDEGLFPVTKFPCSVHIARPLIDNIEFIEEIKKEELEVVAWGDLYRTKSDADEHVFDEYRPFASPRQEPPVRPQKMSLQRPLFLGEQDGLPERELKKQLTTFFDRAHWVRVAYLARVRYEDIGPVHVAVCVIGQPGQNSIFAEWVGRIFASIFGSHEHLDIIWLMPDQEAALAKVCRPFFELLV